MTGVFDTKMDDYVSSKLEARSSKGSRNKSHIRLIN